MKEIENASSASIIEIAKKVISQEIEGLKDIEKLLDESTELGKNFEKLINKCLSIKGRVIISGVGKSGHIANKISATLSSTGTPSLFIHPSEASHGDLGMITKSDIVILLSNSGETSELKDIIYYCKRFGICLVGVVRRASSLLVEHSDITLILPETLEANSINAPTTSSMQMLALGDAIAVTLLEKKSFNKEDFAIFHPGGKLGANFLTIGKLMLSDAKKLPIVGEDALLSEAVSLISEKMLGCCLVSNSENILEGIITDGDLRRVITKGGYDLNKKPLKEVMTKSPKSVTQNCLATKALNIMNEKKITALPVVNSFDENEIIGIIHIHHLLKGGVS